MLKRLRIWALGVLAAIGAILGWNLYAVDSGLAWQNPQFFDGTTTPLPAGFLTSARIYRKKDNGAYAVLATIPIGTSYNDLNLTDGVYCYQVAVLGANSVESPKSNEACKTVDTRRPGAPTGLTIN